MTHPQTVSELQAELIATIQRMEDKKSEYEETQARLREEVATEFHRSGATLPTNLDAVVSIREKSDSRLTRLGMSYTFARNRVDTLCAILNLMRQGQLLQRLDRLVDLQEKILTELSRRP